MLTNNFAFRVFKCDSEAWPVRYLPFVVAIATLLTHWSPAHAQILPSSASGTSSTVGNVPALRPATPARPLLPPQGHVSGTSDIADNSFLLEEAYNQEFGVVQHISSFHRNWNTKEWIYSFTQEWPFNPAPRIQLSYTIPFLSSSIPGDRGGIGDVLLNFRYQVVGDGSSTVAFAPRVSLLVPSGSRIRGRGDGATGVQVNLPVSIRHHPKLFTHWNAGATFIPGARNELNEKASTYGVNLGQSFIVKFTPRFNAMLETVFESSESIIGPNLKTRENSLIINPGFRWAYNFESGLQIVPGISFPVGAAGTGRGTAGFLLYLSFEHPFGKAASKGK